MREMNRPYYPQQNMYPNQDPIDMALKGVTPSYMYYQRVHTEINQIMHMYHFGLTIKKTPKGLDYATLRGTIPTVYKGKQFNTPILIMFPYDYPLTSPICFVETPGNMEVIPNHSIVYSDNSIRHYMLYHWNQNDNIPGLLDVLKRDLYNNPPLRMKQEIPLYPNQTPSPPSPYDSFESPKMDANVQSIPTYFSSPNPRNYYTPQPYVYSQPPMNFPNDMHQQKPLPMIPNHSPNQLKIQQDIRVQDQQRGYNNNNNSNNPYSQINAFNQHRNGMYSPTGHTYNPNQNMNYNNGNNVYNSAPGYNDSYSNYPGYNPNGYPNMGYNNNNGYNNNGYSQQTNSYYQNRERPLPPIPNQNNNNPNGQYKRKEKALPPIPNKTNQLSKIHDTGIMDPNERQQNGDGIKKSLPSVSSLNEYIDLSAADEKDQMRQGLPSLQGADINGPQIEGFAPFKVDNDQQTTLTFPTISTGTSDLKSFVLNIFNNPEKGMNTQVNTTSVKAENK